MLTALKAMYGQYEKNVCGPICMASTMYVLHMTSSQCQQSSDMAADAPCLFVSEQAAV